MNLRRLAAALLLAVAACEDDGTPDAPAASFADTAVIDAAVRGTGSWVQLGGSATGGGLSGSTDFSSHSSLALDSSGNPAVAWLNVGSGPSQIYVARWNGSAWAGLGGSASGGGLSNSTYFVGWPSIAFDA